jgi:recombination protein RecA
LDIDGVVKDKADNKTSGVQDAPVTKAKSPKMQAIKIAMEQIEKQFGRGAIMKLGEREHLQVESVPTGAIALDLALGVGGLPRGRVTEVYGPEASGKTTVALGVVATAQKAGGQVAFVDAEHALDPAWAEVLGVNLDDLLVSQPDTGEQALEIVETLVRSGALDVIVVDSVAALVPRAEIEGEMGDAMVGVQARLMSQALRKLTGAIAKSRTVVIFTNQLRHKIGVMFGNPETTPGGLALKFYSSVRLDIRKIQTLKEGDKVYGSRHRVRVVKNKVASPFRVAEFDILGSVGISKMGGLLDVGVELGVITKSGAFYKYGEQMLGQGRAASVRYLQEHAKVAGKIEEEIWKKVRSGEKDVPREVGEEKVE